LLVGQFEVAGEEGQQVVRRVVPAAALGAVGFATPVFGSVSVRRFSGR
jgi:hypothetical protein